jgi:hypothetical protein
LSGQQKTPGPAPAEDAEPGVIERCRALRAGHACVTIYGEDMVTVVRTEDCRGWCPLLKLPI